MSCAIGRTRRACVADRAILERGSFIDAEVFAGTGKDVLGSNMFAYYENNSVNMVDIQGSVPLRTTNVMMTYGGDGSKTRLI